MAYGIAACVGLPIWCYVFARYENACAAYDLWRSARLSRGKQCRAPLASVFMCASLIDFCWRKISRLTRFWNTAFAAQLVWSHWSTTSVTERID